MGKITSNSVTEYYQHYPRVVAIITVHARGQDNAMAAAWHTPLSFSPPLYGVSISPKRFTWQLILEANEFGVNFVPFEKAELIAAVGGISGRDVDKFARFKIAKEPAKVTRVPVLRDAYAAFECHLADHKTYGDHEWFVGQIVAVHLEEGCLTDQKVINLDKVMPALYLGSDLYLAAAKETLKHLDRQVFTQ